MSFQGEVAHENLLWLLGSLSELYRQPFDAALIAQQFPPPGTLATLHEAARALGFKTGSIDLASLDAAKPISSGGWQKLPLPAIAFLRPAASTPAPPSPSPDSPVTATPILILKSDGRQLLYFRAGSPAPETLGLDEAPHRLAPELIAVTREYSAPAGRKADIPGFPSERKPFGFRWFLPELLKHKSLWRDILTASLAIQLVGLATPLFTQVIIDKVVVHQSNSTLIVLGIALVMFMLFTSAMSWLRQYLVLHTGNRIDAVLGSQVFRHLLRLPLPYFEQRPTGTLVARLHGIETIREFVSGAAVTLVLDLPFLLIFLAVMFAYDRRKSPWGQLAALADRRRPARTDRPEYDY